MNGEGKGRKDGIDYLNGRTGNGDTDNWIWTKKKEERNGRIRKHESWIEANRITRWRRKSTNMRKKRKKHTQGHPQPTTPTQHSIGTF